MRLRAEPLVASLLLAAAAIAAPLGPRTADLGDGLSARLEGTRLDVVVTPREAETWDALAARALGDPSLGSKLEASAGGTLAPDTPVTLPVATWPPGLGARALLALFPADAVAADGWRHVVTPGTTAWSLAVLFTGSGRNHEKLLDAKGGPPTLRVGSVVVIPAEALRPELRAAGIAEGGDRPLIPAEPASDRPPAAEEGTVPFQAPPERSRLDAVIEAARRAAADARRAQAAAIAEREAALAAAKAEAPEPASEVDSNAPSTLVEECAAIGDDGETLAATEPSESRSEAARYVPAPGARSDDGALAYESGPSGPVAVYRLRAGDTLYTDVVLRFTGLLSGREVNAAARRYAEVSGVSDVTDMAVGTPVRVPLDDLLPQYLPADHPRRQQWEREREESERLARRERRKDLEGVHVLLDSGHGGHDPGAGSGIAWEDDTSYDIACRIMAVLGERTPAVVHPRVQDTSSGHAPLARLVRDTDEILLTTPPTRLDSVPTRVAVNLRWMLSNALLRQLAAEGVADDRVVFVSIHADSLHPSATGAMAYYPSARLRLPSCGIPTDPEYRAASEADEANAFEMTRRQALRSEGLSRDLGDAIIAGVRAAGAAIHGYGPVRGSIQRGGLMVPAVLRYNRVPAAVLVEACNLNNPEDQRSLRDPVFRQAFAEGVVDGLVAYFDGRTAQASTSAASGAGMEKPAPRAAAPPAKPRRGRSSRR